MYGAGLGASLRRRLSRSRPQWPVVRSPVVRDCCARLTVVPTCLVSGRS